MVMPEPESWLRTDITAFGCCMVERDSVVAACEHAGAD